MKKLNSKLFSLVLASSAVIAGLSSCSDDSSNPTGVLSSYRWKDLISSVKKVANYKHFDDSYANAGEVGADGNEVSSFFAKIHKHLKAKYNNVSGRHYRQPIPTGLTGEDLGIIPQNSGY